MGGKYLLSLSTYDIIYTLTDPKGALEGAAMKVIFFLPPREGRVAQRIRARGYEPRSRGFKSLLARKLPAFGPSALLPSVLWFPSSSSLRPMGAFGPLPSIRRLLPLADGLRDPVTLGSFRRHPPSTSPRSALPSRFAPAPEVLEEEAVPEVLEEEAVGGASRPLRA